MSSRSFSYSKTSQPTIRLGRQRVAILTKESAEHPSDIAGLIYRPFKERVEEVKAKLFKDLEVAGYNPRQRGRQRGLGAGQYSPGKWITLLAKYSVISSSGKSVCSISLVNTMLPLPLSHVSVAVRSGCTTSFQT